MANEKTPADLLKEAEDKKAAREAKEKYQRSVTDAMNDPNPNVRLVLRHIMNLSGFNLNSVTINAQTGDVMVSASIYNAGREAVYHDLRKTMSAETKNNVERSE